MAKTLYIKYLSFINLIEKYTLKHLLFGSATIELDTGNDDLEIKTSNQTKLTTLQQCIQLLKKLKQEFKQLKKHIPLHHKFNNNTNNNNIVKTETEWINVSLNKFTNDKNKNETNKIQNKIMHEYKNDLINKININVLSLQLIEGIIALLMVKYNLEIISSNNKDLMKFKVDTTNIFDEMRSTHLHKDKGTHKFLLIVKACEYKMLQIQQSMSTDGFILQCLYWLIVSKSQTQNIKEYESINSDINIPIEMIHL